MKVLNAREIYDDVTDYGISIVNNVMYIHLNDGRKVKLDALIIKEREEN